MSGYAGRIGIKEGKVMAGLNLFLYVVGLLFTIGAMTQTDVFPDKTFGKAAYLIISLFLWPLMLGKIWAGVALK